MHAHVSRHHLFYTSYNPARHLALYIFAVVVVFTRARVLSLSFPSQTLPTNNDMIYLWRMAPLPRRRHTEEVTCTRSCTSGPVHRLIQTAAGTSCTLPAVGIRTAYSSTQKQHLHTWLIK